MKLNHTKMHIDITPKQARFLGEKLIHFAETCEGTKDTCEYVTHIGDADTCITFRWKPIEKNGKIINMDEEYFLPVTENL